MALTIDSIAPTVAMDAGGEALVISSSDFVQGESYNAYVGTTGTSADTPCYAGPGNGTAALCIDGATITVYTPEMTPGKILDIYVKQVGAAEEDTAAHALRVVDRSYNTALWSMKKQLSPNWAVGPREMALLPPANRPANYALYSEEISNAVWNSVAGNVDITDDEPDPLGTSRGALFHEDNTASDGHGVQQNTVATPAGFYTWSVYAKAINRTWLSFGGGGAAAWFDLANGALGSTVLGTPLFATIEPAVHFGETGWYHCSMSAELVATGSTAIAILISVDDSVGGTTFNGLDQDSIRVAFPALDSWSTPRLYRPTTSEAVT